ncbi:Predicted permease [Dethiosulfatibacter aminovorans DSM 17477]|uniref:Predicted permease n=1 Tax=Dethiosulfatibacter aminovorans DSM 17477 TaxID=1121476 RepID=A0A1M6AUT2_9FIRM|nr:permease [Dethiosulfatibacter aminovorans]SHI39983.1 Predicted permease [Dethiosulfatibacter aminovorans DSM 17477]
MVLKKYRFPIVAIIAMAVMFAVDKELGKKAVTVTTDSLFQMLSVLPAVFILIGLMDVWVPRETMIKYLGEHSGIRGVIISFIMGSATMGPLYGAFPVAAVLMKKGAKFSNILIFIGAWSTTKVPMFMFEFNSLGPRFAVTRLVVDVIGIIIISYAINRMLSRKSIEEIYEKAESF